MGDLGGVVAVVLILGVIATFGYLHLQSSPQRTQALQALLVSWERHHVEPDEVVPRLELLGAIVGQVPSYVWKDFGPQAGPGG